MLRLRVKPDQFRMLDAGPALTPPQLEIAPVFDDPLLEAMRLLREATNIEHALAVQYLYAAYAVAEPYYLAISGTPGRAPDSLLGIAVQEMYHLKEVNLLLMELGSAPSFARQEFPIHTDIYPFAFELEPLSKHSLAKYLHAESPLGALDPAGTVDPAERAFRDEVNLLLQGEATNHIGSLYRTIIVRLEEATATVGRLTGLDVADWLARLEAIIGEGEIAHFGFFRSLFQGTHPALAGVADPWNPTSPSPVCLPAPKNPTASEGAPTTIADPISRALGQVANLHYWTMLVLLEEGMSRSVDPLIGQAKQHMIDGLGPLARLLAARGAGVPFDALGLNLGRGATPTGTMTQLAAALDELIALQSAHDADLPPVGYRRKLAEKTKQLIQGV